MHPTRIWQVWSLASLTRWRLQDCHELWCRSKMCSDPELLWLWRRLAAVATIQLQPQWELQDLVSYNTSLSYLAGLWVGWVGPLMHTAAICWWLGSVGWSRMAGVPVPCSSYNLSHWAFFLRAAPAAYGISQARGQIRAAAASLCHRHSNAKCKPCLWPML